MFLDMKDIVLTDALNFVLSDGFTKITGATAWVRKLKDLS